VSRRWICCQIGAREYYAVPRALKAKGRLAVLYTDYWAGSGIRQLAERFAIGKLRSLAGRWHEDLEGSAVTSWNCNALMWESRLRRRAASGKSPEAAGLYLGFMDVGRRFAVRVRDALRRRPSSVSKPIFFAYDTGALELLEWCREQGMTCVLDQMDPNRVEVALVREEERRWPGWALRTMEVPEEYFRRREREWELADRVVVNSEFCRQALIQQGVPREKLFVLPLCYEANQESRNLEIRKLKSGQTLRVLFLGQVILRKGIQYLAEAARQLEGENIQFDIVGPIGISAEAIGLAPRNMTFHGRATRDQAAGWYCQSDVFVLPTLSDGFAITQLEAMAHGLPVVTTACCGDVVTDGVDGFIVPARDPKFLARTLMRYLVEAGLLADQRTAALAKSKQFSQDRLAANLLELEADLAPV
jgi:glycosyltransferase involved in cell wall biosynthesis